MRREHPQGLVWGIFIIVFKSARKLRHHGFGIWSIIAEDVISFECFDESFSHAIALGAASRSKFADDSQRSGKSYCVSCCVAGAVVGEPFNWLQCFDIPNRFSTHASMTLCAMSALYSPVVAAGHHFPAASIQQK